MPKIVVWPTAVGFLLAVLLIVILQANVTPGGERLQPNGMAFIICGGSAVGALVGALLKALFSNGGGSE